MRLLLLGGTSEASELARRLAGRGDIHATLSLAGRTSRPASYALPTRVGGFGGVAGLAAYLDENRIDAVIDATHPFAAQMSAFAVAACERVPLAVLTRPEWVRGEGDDWREVDGLAQAVTALGDAPRRVLLTVGRLHVGAFAAAPQHAFVLRSIDAPAQLPPGAEVVLARPPFSYENEIELMRSRRIDILVSKNSGGEATRAKLDAARDLRIPVVMLRRPPVLARTAFYEVDEAMAWIHARASALRGVSK